MALFLVIAGLTGSILPFEEELTFLSRPSLSHVQPPRPRAHLLDGIEIAQRVERLLGAQVVSIPLDVPADHVVRMFVTARPGDPALPFDVVWANPYSGDVVLVYRWGGLRDGAENVVPFLFSLHYGIVAGPWGEWLFGIAGLIWTLDCFVGFYLTLPMPRRSIRRTGHATDWWLRWKRAWLIRTGASGSKLNFDIHRAVGLWLWALLFAFAWSSVGLLLPSVERPVMRAFGAPADYAPAVLKSPLRKPAVDFHRALEVGIAALRGIGRRDGFTYVSPQSIRYDALSGAYEFDAKTSLDRFARGGNTAVWIDGRTGQLIHFQPPYGTTHAEGVRQLFLQLHFADVLGLPYRIFVSALGLILVILTLTGIVIWMRKREARWLGNLRRQSQP